MTSAIQFLERVNLPNLAYVYTKSSQQGDNLPIVVFLGGFKSDMDGTKALYLEEQCRKRGQAYLRMDYSGHGRSGGEFKDGTISTWRHDVQDILEHLNTDKDMVLVGSSMGGWIALLTALRNENKVKGVIGIAAAPDFTQDIWDNRLSPAQRDEIKEKGYIEEPNEYSDEPYIFTYALINDGKSNFVLNRTHNNKFPISLIQGMKDDAVNYTLTSVIEEKFKGANIKTILIDDGDHRLSRPQDLELINFEIERLSAANLST